MQSSIFTKKYFRELNKEEQKDLVLPPYIRSVEKEALSRRIIIRSVEMSGVREIGNSAFIGCSSLRKVSMPSVEKVGKSAFAFCSSLSEITFPRHLKKIGSRGFEYCVKLRNAVFPEEIDLKMLPSGLFGNDRQLEKVVLPGNLEEIGRQCFYKCESLTDIKLPDTLKIIGPEAFYQCGFTDLTLPEGLLEIGESAFLKCKSLPYLHVPSGVKKIEKWAFHGCNRLTCVEFTGNPEICGGWVTNRNCTVRCRRGTQVAEISQEQGCNVEYID